MKQVIHIMVFFIIINFLAVISTGMYTQRFTYTDTFEEINYTNQLWSQYDTSTAERSDASDTQPSLDFKKHEQSIWTILRDGTAKLMPGSNLETYVTNPAEAYILGGIKWILYLINVVAIATMVIVFLTKDKNN